MQYIGESAFASCSRLVQADLPENVVSIGATAFYNTGNESVSVGRKVEVIGEGAFGSCSALAEINVDAANPYYEMKDDMLLENGETVLLCLRNMSGEVTVPERVKTIPYDAFADCDALTFIQIPASVTTIEYGAFGNYGALTMVVYAGSQAQWDAMDIGEYNNNLLAAKLYINGAAHKVNGLYLGSLSNIAAKAMRTPVYMRMVLTRADGSRIYSPIVRYSVESYAHKVQNTQSSSPEVLALTDKLMRYGDAAAAYFR